jgi:tetratricopeptide (TPR) repeat protein
MSQLEERIAQFRKMASDDPDNELGHYRLGQLLMENGQYEEAIRSFRRTLELSPQFSKVYQLLAQALLQSSGHFKALQGFRAAFAGIDPKMPPTVMADYAAEHGREDLAGALRQRDRPYGEAVATLKEGFAIADERGDNIPRDEMARLLAELGEQPPAPKRAPQARAGAAGEGFRCQRPGCFAGNHARRLPRPPMSDALGQQIYENICADCWDYWLRNLSIKVINEMRLDLSTEHGQEAYDQIMRETLGLK